MLSPPILCPCVPFYSLSEVLPKLKSLGVMKSTGIGWLHYDNKDQVHHGYIIHPTYICIQINWRLFFLRTKDIVICHGTVSCIRFSTWVINGGIIHEHKPLLVSLPFSPCCADCSPSCYWRASPRYHADLSLGTKGGDSYPHQRMRVRTWQGVIKTIHVKSIHTHVYIYAYVCSCICLYTNADMYT